MSGHSESSRGLRYLCLAVLLTGAGAAQAATKQVDLDGATANGAESQCSLNVLSTFPVKIENVVTNKAVGDTFEFTWKSAGPGGFTASVAPGSTGGVGAKWTWTTNQTVYTFTGSSCADDICFLNTGGPDPMASTCSAGCFQDGVTVGATKGATAEDVVLSWGGGTGPFTVYRASGPAAVDVDANNLGTTTGQQYTDRPPPGGIVYYIVRAAVCNQRKSCASNSDCNPLNEGVCASRGPFAVPGRSLSATDITVSSASLTSSLITFFSPPKEIFRATSTADPGAIRQTYYNNSNLAVTANTPEYPPGCCPGDAATDHKLRCGEECVDYLTDPNNCGACGNVCGEGSCCANGNCVSLCAADQIWCNGRCVDLANDSANCGTCGENCDDGTCCDGGLCASVCADGQVFCDGACADLQNDNDNCGACGNACGDDACCQGGTCVGLTACDEGLTWCGESCLDLRNDNDNCGACGNACGDGTCCNEGVCASVCAPGQIWCNGACVDPTNDSANCGACGNSCGDAGCCQGGTCVGLTACDAGLTWCGESCLDLQNDNDNCGACGNACGDGTCCNGGSCVSVCGPGQLWCNGACIDVQNDTDNCGACGNVCGDGTCCNGGSCTAFSACDAGRTLCDGLCYDLQNDPLNCGACGNVCDGQSTCSMGVCSPCSGMGGRKDSCDNRCVNLNTDPYNCGACGVSCNEGCPSGFKGVCSNGQSCSCVAGTPAPPPPPNSPEPTAPFCQNPNPHPDPIAGMCPNPHLDPGPVPGFCPNPTPTGPVAGFCPNPHLDPAPVPGFCPNAGTTEPVGGVCPNPDPTYPTPGYCPSPGPPAPGVAETPICVVNASSTTIPPGGTSTICTPSGLVFKEVASTVSVCGDNIPGPDGACADGISKVSSGTFMRLVPATEIEIGNAYLTPYAVHVLTDTSMDGLIEPGETATVVIEVLNAGPASITGASATLVAPPFDLSEDGVDNPIGVTIGVATSPYGTIAGTQPSLDCEPLTLHPAANSIPFQITLPLEQPGDSARPFQLLFAGTVNGAPYAATVPIALGIADRCDYAAATRDFDGLDGLLSPLARLVPVGDTVPFPSKTINAGSTVPMKLRATCGGMDLRGADVDAPEVVGLSEATRGPIDFLAAGVNADDSGNSDPFFRWNDTTKQWIYNLGTTTLGTGRFTITIRIAGRKDYVTGFELR